MFGGLGVALGVLIYLPMTLFAPLESVSAQTITPAPVATAAAQLTWPSYGTSAIGALDGDGVLAASKTATARPMASISKLVTALVVLDKHPLTSATATGPKITMSSVDTAIYHHYLSLNGKVAAVRAGLSFTEKELLELALIDSANNYAASLAVWAYGSDDAFFAAEKAWTAAHHLTSIQMFDPAGLDKRNVSTASDLVALGRLALANPALSAIVSTKSVNVHDIGIIHNTNTLLGKHGVMGLKTGTLNGYGSNLLFSAILPVGTSSVTVIGAVLGAPDHATVDKDVTRLISAATAGYHEVDLARHGDAFATYSTAWGQSAKAVADTTATTVVWGDTKVTAKISADPITLGDKGQKVGSVRFTFGGRTVTVPLVLSTAITDPGPGWRISHPALLSGAA